MLENTLSPNARLMAFGSLDPGVSDVMRPDGSCGCSDLAKEKTGAEDDRDAHDLDQAVQLG